MNYYIVPAITSAIGNILPNVPAGAPCVGVYDSATDSFLIGTTMLLSDYSPLTYPNEVENAAQKYGISFMALKTWRCT